MTNRGRKFMMSTWKSMLLAGAAALAPAAVLSAPTEAPLAEVVATPADDEEDNRDQQETDPSFPATHSLRERREMDTGAENVFVGKLHIRRNIEPRFPFRVVRCVTGFPAFNRFR